MSKLKSDDQVIQIAANEGDIYGLTADGYLVVFDFAKKEWNYA